MQISRVYAFIGSRNLEAVPFEGMSLYSKAAKVCGEKGYLVKTGAAPGADQLASETCLTVGGYCALYLPWQDYEAEWVSQAKKKYGDRVWVADSNPMRNLQAVAAIAHHPVPEKLSAGEKKLMARNFLIVQETQGVFAIPKPPCEGGTAHGIRCGEVLGIPVYNLSVDAGRDLFHARLAKAA